MVALHLAVALGGAGATLTSVPAGRLADLQTDSRALLGGIAAFGVAYIGFAFTGASIILLAACFIAAGVGIGAVETAEHSAVATLAFTLLLGRPTAAAASIR